MGDSNARSGRSASRRQTYIQIRMDSMIEEYRQERQQRWCPRWCPDCAGGGSGGGGLGESAARAINFVRFSLVCCAGAFNATAPWALAAGEAAAVLLIYFLAVPDALWTRIPPAHFHYSLDASCEDVVLLSLLRFVAVLAAYLLGSGPQYQRPYLWAAMISAAISLPFVLVKTALLRHSALHRAQWPSHLAVYATNGGFSLAHMVAAQRVVSWARKRYESGLLGFGYPWEEGEQTWLLAGRLRPAGPRGPADLELEAREPHDLQDVPAEQLADEDSRFLEDCQGLRVHYKLALPEGAEEQGAAGILLIHSFGGGTFSWRHIMQPLAQATGMAVVAFDRPGFGLTSRPEVPPKTPLEDNPYSLKFQAVLALKLAWQLGLQRVLLVGHEDGALLALMASAMACRKEQHFTFSPAPAQRPATPPVAFPALVPLSPAQPIVPTIPQSMEAAWEGCLTREGPRGFLQRLLRGEFSPSPTNGVLGGGLAPPHWGKRPRRGGAPHQQQQQPLLLDYSLRRASLDSADWQDEGRGEAWWAQRLAARPARLAATPPPAEGEAGEQFLLPRSTDTSPPHNVGPRAVAGLLAGRHEPAWTSAGAVGMPLGEAGGQAALPAGWQAPQLLPWQGAAAQQQGPVSSSRRSLLGQYWVAAGAGSGEATPTDSTTAAPAPAALPAPPAQQRMAGPTPVRPAPLPDISQLLSTGQAASAALLSPSQLPSDGQAAGGEESQPSQPQSPAPPPLQAGPEPPSAAPPAAAPADAALSPPQQEEQPAPPPCSCADEPVSPTRRPPGWQLPLAAGLVLLHPDLSGQVAPRYCRVLGNSRLGRRVLRTLLRTEVGEASNRRAWADDAHLTPELLRLYKRPLQVEGWDRALIEVCRTRNQLHWVERAHLLGTVASSGLPALVMTGERDHMTTPAAAATLSERLPGSRLAVLPGCGHLAHEERPRTLLDFLSAFVLDVLAQ